MSADEKSAGGMYRRTAPRVPVTGPGPELQATPSEPPAGTARADAEITSDAKTRLEQLDDVDVADLTLRCTDGVISVRGRVADEARATAIVAALEVVAGVRGVESQLHVEG